MKAAPGLRIAGSAAHGTVPLFDGLDMRVHPGGWTCLLGVSGVGKSTILRLIAGLPHGAKFEGVLDVDIEGPVEEHVAYMAQSDLLLPWATVLDNVTLGARLRGETPDHARAAQLIDEVGLGDHISKKPHALSGGQRQRVALARTLMEDRAINLLDEPFSALDARTRAEMQELAYRLLAGRTVLLVTHDPGEAARLGDKIFVMTETGVTEVEPPSGRTPRALDSTDVLAAQARLLALLRVG